MVNQNTYSQANEAQNFDLLNEPVSAYSPTRIALIRKGIKLNALNHFIKKTGLTRLELSSILQVSARTLQRVDDNLPLSPAITERLLQLNDLYNLAKESLGDDPKNITIWLREKNHSLGMERPLDFLDTYTGIQEVQLLLGRLSYGIY